MLFSLTLSAQTVYELPFASKGNEIELAVANTSNKIIEGIFVEVESAPEWINFGNTQVQFAELRGTSEMPALFEFAVDKRAPVGETGRILIKVTNTEGDKWSREINVTVSKPDNYELTQNYPNPFNPTTKIEFMLPVDERVTLKIFDMLGREVQTMIDEVLPAGHHEAEFIANNLASGTYIYVLATPNFRQIKKMLLLK